MKEQSKMMNWEFQNLQQKCSRKRLLFFKKREKIIFDLSIEIWPKDAKRYSFLFLIECKSSNSKKVPVDDVEEFWAKVDQVAGKNVKGVMISDNSFQKGGLTFAKNTGMMLIEVDSENNHKIILHRTDKEKDKKDKKIPLKKFSQNLSKNARSKKSKD